MKPASEATNKICGVFWRPDGAIGASYYTSNSPLRITRRLRLPQGTHEFLLSLWCSPLPSTPPARHALSDCVCAQQDAVLQEIAASGESKYEWAALKPLLASKVEQACREYYETSQDIDESKNGDTFDAVLKRTLSLLDAFPNAPFTLQRLCELLLDPRKPYRTSTRKLMSAIEKLLSVSSTVPVMSALPAKPGSYQAAAEYELAKLITGEAGAAEAMEVESHP